MGKPGDGDWVAEVCDDIKELTDKIKRGDIIPMTRMAKCDCEGGWCDKCKGKGATFSEAYLNDWPDTGAGSAGGAT
jgi:hypothetical protein